MSVRLNPKVQYVKNSVEEDWTEVEADSWYVYDTEEEEYYDKETGKVAPHRRSPGVCIAFKVGKKEVAISIPWKNLVHTMSDVIKQDEKWRQEEAEWKNQYKAVDQMTEDTEPSLILE